MKHEINTWLEDINIAIKQIYDFLPEDFKYSDFEDDIKTQKAIERNIVKYSPSLDNFSLKLSLFSFPASWPEKKYQAA